MLTKKDSPLNLTLTPEQSLELMRGASNTFYQLAALTQCHPFLEFTGILNEYIKICEENYKLREIDFREENIHTGKNQMVIADYMIDYINEKLECIFQGLVVVKRREPEIETLILTEIELSNGKKLVCREPLNLTIEKEGDLFVVREPKLGLHAYEYTREALVREVNEDFSFLWKEYALEDVDKLAEDAIQLKENLLNFFTEK